MRVLWLCAALIVVPGVAWAQAPAADDITDERLEEGARLYNGPGVCMGCHGQDARGVPGLGADLTDAEWLHSDGTFGGILETILGGVTGANSSTGVPMPPRGGSRLTDEQLRAVAAYVWSLSQSEESGST
jgi:mono/diheme cytochrome c family protein